MKKLIRADLFNRTHSIAGPLGAALGEVLTLEVLVKQPPRVKAAGSQLDVLSVNGKRLAKPINMTWIRFRWGKLPALAPGKSYKLRAYQDGGMRGIPHQAMKETVFVQTTAHHFACWLVLLREVS